MPMVPNVPGASGSSPLGLQPSPSDLLMAAAEMHGQGKLTKFKQPNPTKPSPARKKLKVIK